MTALMTSKPANCTQNNVVGSLSEIVGSARCFVSVRAVSEDVPALHAGFAGDPVDLGVPVQFHGLNALTSICADGFVRWRSTRGDRKSVPSTRDRPPKPHQRSVFHPYLLGLLRSLRQVDRVVCNEIRRMR